MEGLGVSVNQETAPQFLGTVQFGFQFTNSVGSKVSSSVVIDTIRSSRRPSEWLFLSLS